MFHLSAVISSHLASCMCVQCVFKRSMIVAETKEGLKIRERQRETEIAKGIKSVEGVWMLALYQVTFTFRWSNEIGRVFVYHI